MDVAPLGGEEMAQFVDEDDEAEAEDDQDGRPQAIERRVWIEQPGDAAKKDGR